MENGTKNLLKEKLESLPPEFRSAVTEADVPKRISAIGASHNLHIDQEDALFTETVLLLVGITSPDNFAGNVAKNVNVDNVTATAIAKEVAEQIFNTIRNIMVNSQENPPNQNPEQNPNKEDILSEIENPTPVVHPISIADQTIAGPAMPREIITEAAKDQVSKDFIADKLSETINMPAQKPPEKPKSYEADPYREAVN